jgi:hydrogen peroxide-dependent heme synthase
VEELVFAAYPVFKAVPDRIEHLDRPTAGKELAELLEEHSDKVATRGVYTTAGFSAEADLMMWWIAGDADHLQDLTVAFRTTQLGRALVQTEAFLGLVRPAEFSKDHLPAFAAGKAPKPFLCVYPFVRTPEWYLLDPAERAKLLREHGEAARVYPDVLANTTSAFGLGDFEWILAFEADSPDRIVDLIRALRATEARRYTKVEVPFVTGIRRDPADALALL